MSEEILAEWTATDAEGDGGLPYVPPLAQFGGARQTVPGLLTGITLQADLSAPYIENGMAYLPLTPGAEDDDTPPTPCNCQPASYDGEHCCLGLVSSVSYEQDLPGPRISNGGIKLPLCTTEGECPGIVGGIASVLITSATSTPYINNGVIHLPAPELKGLHTEAGPRTWNDLNGAGIVPLHGADATGPGVSALFSDGYLQIYVNWDNYHAPTTA